MFTTATATDSRTEYAYCPAAFGEWHPLVPQPVRCKCVHFIYMIRIWYVQFTIMCSWELECTYNTRMGNGRQRGMEKMLFFLTWLRAVLTEKSFLFLFFLLFFFFSPFFFSYRFSCFFFFPNMWTLTVRDFPGVLKFTNCDRTPPYLDRNFINRENLGEKLSGKNG